MTAEADYIEQRIKDGSIKEVGWSYGQVVLECQCCGHQWRGDKWETWSDRAVKQAKGDTHD